MNCNTTTENMGDCEIVFFDVETTGFSRDDEIVQIAACSGNSFFNVFITPTRPFHWKASAITGLEMHNGNLYLHNRRIRSISRRNAFRNFMDYLRRIDKKIILVAHNCFGFDMPRIILLASELNFLYQFKKLIHGFSDSLVILRSVLRERRKGKGRFTLKNLAHDYVSATELSSVQFDVEALQLLLFEKGLDISKELVINRAKSIDQYFEEQEFKRQVTEAKSSLQYYSQSLPPWLINKMAKSRITTDILRDIYQRNGFPGIRRLFSRKYYGRACVTKNIKIMHNVCDTIHIDLFGNL